MQKTSQIRFGVIGSGQIAYHAADVIKSNPHATLAAAHDSNAERLKAFCEKCGVKESFPSLEALLASKEVDALYIATPNKFHVPLAMQALEAGKHVILEKPFAMNHGEAAAAADLAKKKGLVLSVGMNQRFTRDSQQIKTLVANGELGEVYHAKATWRRRSGIPKLGTWFANRELSGGGSLYDIGVHMLDLCLFAMDNFSPVSVSGSTYSKFGPRGLGEGGWGLSEKSETVFDVEDFAAAFIRFANGASMTLEAVWACHTQLGNIENVELFGTEAGATLRPARLFRAGKAAPSAYEIIDVVNAPVAMEHCDRFHNFINHLRGEEPLCVSLEQALVVQHILDAIAESSRTGREVRIG